MPAVMPSDWTKRGPLARESIVPKNLCAELDACFRGGKPVPRSYQGIVDPALRRTDFVVVPEALEGQVSECLLGPVNEFFGIASASVPDQSMLIYSYPVGAGFVSHHDEPTPVEEHRAETNGQPVIRGDLTIIVSVNEPDEYAGGDLYFDGRPDSYRLPAGSVVAFPATRDWPHGVRPIHAGERLTAVMRVLAKVSSP